MEIIVTILYIVACVLLFALAIVIHEFGHFIVALKLGLRVEAFSLGFGPVLWRRKVNGVEYRISAIPLGGYVSIPDVDPEGTKALEGEGGWEKEEGRRKKEEGSKEEGREEEKKAQREAFSLFWQAYPRKVGKEDAFQAFLEANVAIHPLLQALERHKQSEEWQRQSGRFIPNPANYLRLRRFEDDLPSFAPSPPCNQTPCDDTMRHYLAALHERRNHVPR